MRLLALIAFALLAAMPVAAQRTPYPEGTVEIAYGDGARQRLDFTPAARAGSPLVLFVHGGAWSMGDKAIAGHMAAHFHQKGYAFASVNYRLVPDADPRQQAEDVAAAIARLLEDSTRLGIDRDRVMIMGHSAGAHLAALVGTDPFYLEAHHIPIAAIARLLEDSSRLGIDRERVMIMGHSAGAHLAALVGTDPSYLEAHHIPIAAIRGVVLLDGAGYDVAAQVQQAGPLLRFMYRRAFGDDPAFQARVSPTRQAEAPNARRFLILHIASRADSGAQSVRLGALLNGAGTPAEVVSVDNSHAEIFRRFGQAGHRATALTDAFADALFRR